MDLLEEEAAVDPRVDLACRLVAMELVFSDMRERNNKKGIVNEGGKSQQTTPRKSLACFRYSGRNAEN